MQAPQPAPVPKQHRPCDGMVWNCKDKGTKSFAHMLDLQEYGVTKKWVIITEISKEVENNNIEDLMRILSIMCLEVLV